MPTNSYFDLYKNQDYSNAKVDYKHLFPLFEGGSRFFKTVG